MANRCMKKCSILLIIRETQIKTTRYVLLRWPEWPLSKDYRSLNAGECGEKGKNFSQCRENTYSVGENVNCCSHSGEWNRGYLKK